MTDPAPYPPAKEAVIDLLDLLAPGSVLMAVNKLPGSFSNFTYLVEAQDIHRVAVRLVLRCYANYGDYDRAEKASREFKTYELLRLHRIPAPQPLCLDQYGELLGTPGIVTSYAPGTLILSPSDPPGWARALATTLAQIHSVPCSPAEQNFLLNADLEATWFLRSGAPPKYMLAYPLGEAVWQTTRDLFPHLTKIQPGLVHVDYWPGNILWHENQISAVVDWEEAAYGDPAIDVAYCWMNMVLDGLAQAAKEFLQTYESKKGEPAANLAFWKLAAAARPMIDPESWQITEPPRGDRFKQFVESALEETRSEFKVKPTCL